MTPYGDTFHFSFMHGRAYNPQSAEKFLSIPHYAHQTSSTLHMDFVTTLSAGVQEINVRESQIAHAKPVTRRRLAVLLRLVAGQTSAEALNNAKRAWQCSFNTHRHRV